MHPSASLQFVWPNRIHYLDKTVEIRKQITISTLSVARGKNSFNDLDNVYESLLKGPLRHTDEITTMQFE